MKSRGSSSRTTGRGDAGGAGGGGGGDSDEWQGDGEGRASDLRQMPSQIAVQDVYPPELSRYMPSLVHAGDKPYAMWTLPNLLLDGIDVCGARRICPSRWAVWFR